MKPLQENNFSLDEKNHYRFQTLVLNRTGMLMGRQRENDLDRGVTALALKVAGGELDRYYHMLKEAETDSPLWDDLIQGLTIGETYFFRDKSQMEALQQHILPRIILSHRHDRRIRVWSAGCASGEEAYTLAMLLSELVVTPDQWRITILATDIDKAVLEKARRADYRNWSFRQTDGIYKSRYFRKHGDVYHLVPWIQKLAHFSYLNLNEAVYPSSATSTTALDLILCRNVAIYYSEGVVRQVVERFHRCLIPGGWLMVGASETSIPVFHQYTACNFPGATVFRKGPLPASVPVPFDAPPEETFSLFEEVDNCLEVTMAMAEDDNAAAESASAPWGETADFNDASPCSAPRKDRDTKEAFKQGVQLMHEKQYEKAIDTFQFCIRSDPSDVSSLYHLARIHANIGKMEAALSFCERLIEIDPLNPEIHYILALVHQETGDLVSAETQLKKALFIDSRFTLAHFSMALVCQQLGRREKAERHRRQALALANGFNPETVLQGSDDITAEKLLTLLTSVSWNSPGGKL